MFSLLVELSLDTALDITIFIAEWSDKLSASWITLYDWIRSTYLFITIISIVDLYPFILLSKVKSTLLIGRSAAQIICSLSIIFFKDSCLIRISAIEVSIKVPSNNDHSICIVYKRWQYAYNFRVFIRSNCSICAIILVKTPIEFSFSSKLQEWNYILTHSIHTY